jgi:hypothetical protein
VTPLYAKLKFLSTIKLLIIIIYDMRWDISMTPINTNNEKFSNLKSNNQENKDEEMIYF